MKQSRILRILSGEDRSLSGRLARRGLRLLSPGYAIATDLRNWGYDAGWLPVQRIAVPVISIGNVTTGGTGKTPTVAWLAGTLATAGFRPGILSRGYRSLDGQANDEKRLLDQQCPGVPHIQTRDRVTGARQLIQQTGVNVIILDDGFQHRRLHRDFDLVLIDVLNPWGYGALLPGGLLRERLQHLRRANALLLTRCELAEETRLREIEEQLARWSNAPVYRSTFEAVGLVDFHGRRFTLDTAAGRSVCAFCGIGNPGAFRRTLARMACPVSDERLLTLPDHYHYTDRDWENLGELAVRTHAELVLTTRKDLVKVTRPTVSGRPILAVDIELSILGKPQSLWNQISTAIDRTGQAAGNP